MQNFLFICGKNQLRSPTAENIFSEYENLEVRSAGVNDDALHIIDQEDIEWAEHIYVMEEIHRVKLLKRFPNLPKDKKIIVLNIPDQYKYMDEDLIKILEKKVGQFIKAN